MLFHPHQQMYPGGPSVITIMLSTLALMLQQAVPDISSGTVGQIERLGLTGALLVAVGVLWRSLARKDEQLTLITRQVAEGLATNTDTQRELRSIVEASTKAKQDLKAAIDELSRGMGRFPCQLDDLDTRRVRERPRTSGAGYEGGG